MSNKIVLAYQRPDEIEILRNYCTEKGFEVVQVVISNLALEGCKIAGVKQVLFFSLESIKPDTINILRQIRKFREKKIKIHIVKEEFLFDF